MEESFFKSALPVQDYLQLKDTSLALPTEPTNSSSARTESAGKNLRVQRQVQLSLRRNTKKATSNGEFKLQGMTSRSLDDVDKMFSHTKVNMADFSSLSLKGNHFQGPRRMASHTTPNTRLSHRRFIRSISVHGTSSPSRHNHFQSVVALKDCVAGSNAAQLHTFSGILQGTAIRAATSQPGMYRSKSLRRSLGGRYPSGSMAFKQSPSNTWSHRQTVVKQDKRTVQQGLYNMAGTTLPERGLSWQTRASQRHQTSLPSIEAESLDKRRREETEVDGQQWLFNQKTVKKRPEMTIFKAFSLLDLTDEETLVSATRCIQSRCLDDDNRDWVYNVRGVLKLLKMLQNDSEEVQRNAAGALRNAVYAHNDNKTEVKACGGLVLILDALENTRDKETIHQLSGLLWNLSSDDTIKEQFDEKGLNIITKSVLVPSSGMNAAENPKDEMIADPKAFHCATGCLRNLSSAGPNVRRAMRKCKNLIDSLVYYIQGTIASRKPDDDSTENCVCILQNLTYQAECDFDFQSINDRKEVHKNSTFGCFSKISTKIPKEAKDSPHAVSLEQWELKEMKGAEWLYSKSAVRVYLSLLACSKRSLTQQAAIGALQNLTAGKGEISEHTACTLVEAENGLQKIKMVLDDGDNKLKKPAIYLTKNLSCFPKLHPEIFGQLIRGILSTLQSSDTDFSSEVGKPVFQILLNLSQTDVHHAKYIIKDKAVVKFLRSKHKGLVETQDVLPY
ncbi:plakophilin-2 [Cyprinodon tularosa]|uniref:plakophilin-2 n=1 Tax=Cyprinodon tularosa TaxID=77115 RepID=UPI0018E228C3|nr:plakophilin-2 [Cyprinodon tularosa]